MKLCSMEQFEHILWIIEKEKRINSNNNLIGIHASKVKNRYSAIQNKNT